MITIKDPRRTRERALLVGLEFPESNRWLIEDSMDELSRLAETAGVIVVGKNISRRRRPTAATYIGKGKAEEIADYSRREKIEAVIFDDDLSPAQLRNLQDTIGVKVLDRTELILDIFASRARTREAKLQIELAQLAYLLPRLSGKGVILSRLGGGIGTRGPGETKLEVDRRKIRDRIHQLKKELEKVRRHRSAQSKRRREAEIPVVSIIGYTNSGKSTLLNALTEAEVRVEDKLFATLDPSTRRSTLPSGRRVLFSDTVGFVRKLPHHLIEAFRATLEEVRQADLLLEVLDISHPLILSRKRAVENVLRELAAGEKPRLAVLNKTDLVKDEFLIKESLARIDNSVSISALEQSGLDQLLEKIDRELSVSRRHRRLLIPQQNPELIAALYERGTVLKSDYHQRDVYLEVLIEDRRLGELSKYLLA